MVRKRKNTPRKATVPLSQQLAQQDAQGKGEEKSAAARPLKTRVRPAKAEEPAACALQPEAAQPPTVEPQAAVEPAADAPLSDTPPSPDAPANQAQPAEAAEALPSSDAPANLTQPANAQEASQPAEDPDAADVSHPQDAPDSDEQGASDKALEGDEPASKEADRKSVEEAAARKKAKPKTTKRDRVPLQPKTVVRWVVVAIVALAVAVAVFFAWDRWLRYDDAADFQGTWLVEGTPGSVVIDGQEIHLNESDALSYTLDTSAKTVALSFSDLSGTSRYRFSPDRTQLVIQDGEYGFFDTLGSDIAWCWASFFATITGQPQPGLSFGEGSLVLTLEGSRPVAETTEPADDQEASQEGQQSEQPAEQQPTEQQPADQQPDEQPAEQPEQQQSDNSAAIEEAMNESKENQGQVGSNALRPEDLL